MIPTTPNGTVFLPIKSPFGVFCICSTEPIGSCSSATWRSPSAIASIRSGFRDKRSINASLISLLFAFSTSFLITSSSKRFIHLAASLNTSFLSSIPAFPRIIDASFACFPSCSNIMNASFSVRFASISICFICSSLILLVLMEWSIHLHFWYLHY